MEPHGPAMLMRKEQREQAAFLAEHKPDIFPGLFRSPIPGIESGQIFDREDNVMRCLSCNWEVEDGRTCVRCGFQFGDPSASDFGAPEQWDVDGPGEDLDGEEEGEDEENDEPNEYDADDPFIDARETSDIEADPQTGAGDSFLDDDQDEFVDPDLLPDTEDLFQGYNSDDSSDGPRLTDILDGDPSLSWESHEDDEHPNIRGPYADHAFTGNTYEISSDEDEEQDEEMVRPRQLLNARRAMVINIDDSPVLRSNTNPMLRDDMQSSEDEGPEGGDCHVHHGYYDSRDECSDGEPIGDDEDEDQDAISVDEFSFGGEIDDDEQASPVRTGRRLNRIVVDDDDDDEGDTTRDGEDNDEEDEDEVFY